MLAARFGGVPPRKRHHGPTWHDSYVPVVFLITIAAVLVGIFFAATGRGGELAYEHADHAPLDLGPVSAADIALLRPPTAMWGYNMQVTDEALDRIARAMRERDVTIAYLQEQLATLARDDAYAEPRGVPAHEAAPAARWRRKSRRSPKPARSPRPPSPRSLPRPPASPSPSKPRSLPRPPTSPSPSKPRSLPRPPKSPSSPMPRSLLMLPRPQTPRTLRLWRPPSLEEPSQTPEPPQTPLVLKASPAKAPPAPEPYEATQPSETLQDPEDPDATQPSETLQDPEDPDATQPSETLAPHETQGPQGAFNTHDWWAEQERAARDEAARRRAAGPSGAGGDDSMAAAEEQGW